MTRTYLLPGQRFGRWTVLRYVGLRPACRGSRNRLRVYLCRCDCGKEREVRGSDLTRGVSSSCGCVRWEVRKRSDANDGEAGMKAVAPEARRTPGPYHPEHPEQFTDDWMFHNDAHTKW